MNFPPIVCLSTIDWDFLWQRHQIFMSAFAERGVPVLFVENMGGVRSPSLRDAHRVWLRARSLLRQWTRGIRQAGNITILSPAVLPFSGPWTQRANQRLFLRRLAMRARALGFERPVVWTYSPTWLAARFADLLDPVCQVYDCVANIKGHPFVTPQLIAAEEDWLRRADLVLTDAKSLYIEKQVLNPNTYRVPPGVDFDLFADQGDDLAEPADLSACPRPRLCFFGSLEAQKVDLDLLRQFAVDYRHWSLVIIGTAKTDITMLRELENVVILREKPHRSLPAYLQAMDALCIPYAINEFTRGVIPAKLYECLATGKPVIATAIEELLPFRNVISIADSRDFGADVEAAITNDSPSLCEARVKLARENSWVSRVDRVVVLLEQTLSHRSDQDG